MKYYIFLFIALIFNPHSFSQTTIGDLVNHPEIHDQQTIIILGIVIKSYTSENLCSYVIEDNGNEILVNSLQDCPDKNKKYIIEGTFRAGTGSTKNVIQEKSREIYRDIPPPPPPAVEKFEIVEDEDIEEIDFEELEIEDDIVFLDMEEEENEEEEEPIFFIVEEMPKFQGKDHNTFQKYINEKLIYPEIAAENGISGRVIVQFVVDKEGKVINAKILRGIDPALDKEALRIVNSSPSWTPGKQRGKNVNVQFVFPILFVLQ